ncbi:MAG: TetR/AcrR family transcriptional regulator [Alphaproteobacteria bacterium]|nr:TetR/AcrR family transcriptional regulator [Alphaproteobacteria bacterium]
MEKGNIQDLLIGIGRKIVCEKGTEALTVRKLSEASGCSVGAIYNQFSNMDNFVIIQNFMTLKVLSSTLEKVPETGEPFVDANALLQSFVDFVLKNKNLWFLLYNFHLTHPKREYSFYYLRVVVKILSHINKTLSKTVPEMERPERLLSSQVLWLCVFALSAFLAKDVLEPLSKAKEENICQIMFNTYMAGLTVLERRSSE